MGVDSTLGLFWNGGRGQDNMFEMLDKYDRSLETGRPGYFFNGFLMLYGCYSFNISDFNIIVF
jgi:hypothetical protein